MSIQFDGVEILNTTYSPRFVKHESVAERALITLPLGREDGEAFIAERYGKKVVRLQGIIKASTQALLEAQIATFTELFSRPQKNLDISWNGGTLRYVATCARHDFDRDHYHLNAVPWSAEFVVLSGEGRSSTTVSPEDADEESISWTDGIVDTTFDLEGSKPPKPVATIFITGANMSGIEYKNLDNGERLIATYPGAWGSNRTVEIDFDRKTVEGNVVDSVTKPLNVYGAFPRFRIGTNNVRIQRGGIVNQKSHDDLVSENLADQSIANTSTKYAQSFQVPRQDATFQGITLALRKQSTPGTLTWRIETDSDGSPSGSLVTNATGALAHGSASSSFAYHSLYSASPFQLEANTDYWIVLSAISVDGSNLWRFGSVFPGLYPRGRAKNSSDGGSTWGIYNPKLDLMFRVLMGGIPESGTGKHTIEYQPTYL